MRRPDWTGSLFSAASLSLSERERCIFLFVCLWWWYAACSVSRSVYAYSVRVYFLLRPCMPTNQPPYQHFCVVLCYCSHAPSITSPLFLHIASMLLQNTAYFNGCLIVAFSSKIKTTANTCTCTWHQSTLHSTAYSFQSLLRLLIFSLLDFAKLQLFLLLTVVVSVVKKGLQ